MSIVKTTFEFTVLHHEEDHPHDLEDALNESETGSMVGAVTWRSQRPVPTEEVAGELGRLGNDGTFFDDLEDFIGRLESERPTGESVIGRTRRTFAELAPPGAIAYKYADPTEGARWIYHEDDLARVKSENPSIVEEVTHRG